MNIKLERYFAEYEFSVRYLLSSSDCGGLGLDELLAVADDETRRLWNTLTLGYTESLGHPLLRDEIASLYQGVAPEDCLVIVPEEGIFLAMNSILRPGDHVICTFPGYQSLYEIARASGCEVTSWLPEANNGWRFDPDFLEQAIRPNTKLLIVNFPHNPTGYLPPLHDYQRIVDLARRHNLYLFSDEMYRFLEYDPGARLPSGCELYEKAISLFGMSKTFGMAGTRIGWVVTQDRDLYAQMAAMKDYTTICSSAPSEVLAIIGLRARDQIIARHLNRLKHNLILLDDFFNAFTHMFTWTRPRAGTIAFPELVGVVDSDSFCWGVIQDANVMLLPSTVYDYGNRHFRIGYGRADMPQALDVLTDYLITRR
jgi:aspartate/methionine/tyrosine aminotransferase